MALRTNYERALNGQVVPDFEEAWGQLERRIQPSLLAAILSRRVVFDKTVIPLYAEDKFQALEVYLKAQEHVPNCMDTLRKLVVLSFSHVIGLTNPASGKNDLELYRIAIALMSDRQNQERWAEETELRIDGPKLAFDIPTPMPPLFKNITTVALTNCGLSWVPTALRGMEKVTIWNLSYNKLAGLPSWVKDLPLARIVLENNCITSSLMCYAMCTPFLG